jgi:hypothetical protein
MMTPIMPALVDDTGRLLPTSPPGSVADPAGDAGSRLLAALAERYGGAEFTARSAAADLSRALWAAVGIASPAPAAVGRWLRGRKERGAALDNRTAGNGVRRWKLRGGSGTHPPRPRAARIREPPEKPPLRPRRRVGGPFRRPAAIDVWRGRGARRRGIVVGARAGDGAVNGRPEAKVRY